MWGSGRLKFRSCTSSALRCPCKFTEHVSSAASCHLHDSGFSTFTAGTRNCHIDTETAATRAAALVPEPLSQPAGGQRGRGAGRLGFRGARSCTPARKGEITARPAPPQLTGHEQQRSNQTDQEAASSFIQQPL